MRDIVEDIKNNFDLSRRVLLYYYDQEPTRAALWKDFDDIAAAICELLDSFFMLNSCAEGPRFNAVYRDCLELRETLQDTKHNIAAACCVDRRYYSEYEPEPRINYNTEIPTSFFYSIVGRALSITNILNTD